MTDQVRCLLCDSARSAGGLEKPQASGQILEVRECLQCGHHFLSAWGAEFEPDLYAYYAKWSLSSRADCYNAINTARHIELLSTFAAHVSSRRLLDVGCGAGHLVHTASTEGWDALGIDLSREAIDLCHRFGARAEVRDFFDEGICEQSFDVVIMSELIEHVPCPGRFLARAEAVLAPGGLLYVTTPNYSALTRRIVGGRWAPIHREHLSYFSPSRLVGLLREKTELELLTAATRNLDVGALSLFLRNLVRRPPGGARAVGGPGHDDESRVGEAKQRKRALRAKIENSPALRAAKAVVNHGLAAAQAGETIVLLAKKPNDGTHGRGAAPPRRGQ